MAEYEANRPSFPLFLHPLSTAGDGKQSLTTRIRQIVDSKGHLRTVTEHGLETQVAFANNESLSDTEDESSGDSEVGTLGHTATIKSQMIDMIKSAHEQSMYTVDFISLLLSRYSPQAVNSMSEGLKAIIPSGTIAFQTQRPSSPSEEERTLQALVAQGQRLRGMTNAAAKLLDAANRLELEVKRETKYWQEVSKIVDGEWSVRQVLRGNRHQLGVQLGFLEASPMFKSRGFVALEAGDDGLPVLDRRSNSDLKKIRVRMVRQGRVYSTSSAQCNRSPEHESMQERIKAARDSLFDQELFHECALEAQNLIAYGVRWRDSTIHVKQYKSVKDEEDQGRLSEMLIDLIPQELAHSTNQANEEEEQEEEEEEEEEAKYAALTLKILLLHAYHEKLKKRSRPPPILTGAPRSTRSANILLPFITQNCLFVAVNRLYSYAHKLKSTLDRAGLVGASMVEKEGILSPLLTDPKPQLTPWNLVGCFTKSTTTTLVMTLPSSAGSLEIKVHANLQDATIMPTYTLHLPRALTEVLYHDGDERKAVAQDTASQGRSLPFQTEQEVVSYVDYAFTVDIAHNIVASQQSSWLASAQSANIEVPSPDGKSVKQISILLDGATLRVSWKYLTSHGEKSWTPNEGDQPLKEVIEHLASTWTT